MDRIKKLEEELQESQLNYQMALQMAQFKGGFLARTAHEIRSPLSSLIGLHQLILNDLCEDPQEERQFLEQAYQSALKLIDLIDKIINVAKTTSGRNPLKLQSVVIGEIFTEVHSLIYLQAKNRNLQLEIITPTIPIYAIADRQCLSQIIVGLIDSAISLMEEGSIKLFASISEEKNCLAINIDLDCPASVWQESTNLLETIAETNVLPELSPGMKLLLAQTLLETMRGNLIITEISDRTEKYLTRLQCFLPLFSNE